MLSILRKIFKVAKLYWPITILVIAFCIWLIYLFQNCYLWPDGNCTGFEGKTLWKVLELLIIPFTLIVISAVLDGIERKTDRNAADIRAEVDREIAKDNQRELSLQNYFDAMTMLILDKDLKKSAPNDDVRETARIKTITTIETLDETRKSILVRFLSQTNLITDQLVIGNDPIIELNVIDLSKTFLNDADMRGAHLIHTNLSNVIWWFAKLKGADLSLANLVGAGLLQANLSYTILKMTNMSSADLRDANLEGADMSNADLSSADMTKARLVSANLYGANLTNTKLTNAIYTRDTIWPDGFDPDAAGAIMINGK